MPHWRTLQPTEHLGAPDLPRDKDITVEISKVEGGEIPIPGSSKKDKRVVIHFKGAQKSYISNTTNNRVIEMLYGPDYTEWVGKKITLYVVDGVRNPRYRRNGPTEPPTTLGIRVRPRKPE